MGRRGRMGGIMLLKQSLVEELLESLKNKDYYIEFQNLEDIDLINRGEENKIEVFKRTLIKNEEEKFLELLIKNELI